MTILEGRLKKSLDCLGGERLWCLPEYRDTGVGDHLVEWAVAKADSRNVEMCLEATVFSRPVLQRYGFVPVQDVDMEFWRGKDASEEVKDMVKELRREKICVMRRARGGVRSERKIDAGKGGLRAKL